MKKLSKKSKFVLDKFFRIISVVHAYKHKPKALVEKVEDLEEQVNFFLQPKKAKFLKLRKPKKRKKFKYKKGIDDKIVSMRINGQKGGLKRAANHSREQLAEWGSKAGNTTLSRYGKDFYKHIRSLRKEFPRHKRKLKCRIA